MIARTIKLLISYLLSCAAVLSLPLQTAVMVLNEPRHHVKFENEYVRVIDASMPLGDTTLFHTHPLDNVTCIEVAAEQAVSTSVFLGGLRRDEGWVLD
ncbi:MAG TPA: hypothetical protein VJX74_11275 [Blastocatellia bacterium]|nr:hypothetical protein [Blastocatellia bacterium]